MTGWSCSMTVAPCSMTGWSRSISGWGNSVPGRKHSMPRGEMLAFGMANNSDSCGQARDHTSHARVEELSLRSAGLMAHERRSRAQPPIVISATRGTSPIPATRQHVLPARAHSHSRSCHAKFTIRFKGNQPEAESHSNHSCQHGAEPHPEDYARSSFL